MGHFVDKNVFLSKTILIIAQYIFLCTGRYRPLQRSSEATGTDIPVGTRKSIIEIAVFGDISGDFFVRHDADPAFVKDVLIPGANPVTQALVETSGYEVLVLDIGEFEKLDAGLSCLSLRF